MADFPSRVQYANGQFTGPPILPTSRQFTFGQFPTKSYTTLNGATVKRSFGNRPYGHTLDLEFANVGEEVVSTIFDHYEGQQGTTLGFSIPQRLLRGYEDAVKSRIQNPSGTRWFYLEPPSVESGPVGLSTIRIRLVTELRLR
jgi:hypothetical protein